MPKLIPLKQWYCDVCGEVIAKPADGYVIWKNSSDQSLGSVSHSFLIIHHTPSSPRRPEGSCDEDRDYTSSLSLLDWTGPLGLIQGLSKIDVGEYHAPTFKGPRVRDLREWTELMRRLHLPYYEEARRYWKRASKAYFEGANETSIYMGDHLKGMIEHFENEEDAD